MLPIIAAIAGLVEVAPAIARWIGGAKAGERAEEVAGVVQAVTGCVDPVEGAAMIKADPALQLDFLKATNDLLIRYEGEDTKRLEAVNTTMQAEANNPALGLFRGGWRPYWGWLTGTAWFIQVVGILAIGGYAVVCKPEQAGTIINALAALVGALTVQWAAALAVLGVNVYMRSGDKRAERGQPSGLEALAGLLKRGGN